MRHVFIFSHNCCALVHDEELRRLSPQYTLSKKAFTELQQYNALPVWCLVLFNWLWNLLHEKFSFSHKHKITLKSLFTWQSLCHRMMRQQMGTDLAAHLQVRPFSSFYKMFLSSNCRFIIFLNIAIPYLGPSRNCIWEPLFWTMDNFRFTVRVHYSGLKRYLFGFQVVGRVL